MRIAFAGGWTGGHVLPVQSLIKHISKKSPGQHTFYRFGEKPSLEYTTYKSLTNSVRWLHFFPIHSGKWRREREVTALLRNLRDLFFLWRGFLESLFGLIYYRIDVVFCKWGYVSLPVVIAWWVLRKKVLLHESDTTPGISNRISSKFATTVFTGFSNVFPGKEIVVGQVLDDDLVGQNTCHDGENNQKTHILVTGGSQWSESVYKALYNILSSKAFPDSYFHIILGTKNSHLWIHFSWLQHVKVYDFVDQVTMGKLLHMSDVSITRGGTTSLAEQQLFNIKKIIIPIPWTHDQFKNASWYKTHHQDICIDQNSQTFEKDLQVAIEQFSTYKKSEYSNPLAQIQKTKDVIVEEIVK